MRDDVLIIHEIYASIQGESSFAGVPCTFVRTTGSMQLNVELHDAASGVTVARIIDYEKGREDRELQLANRVTTTEELRLMFANAARYTREALNVAKARREP